jgi:hypothetical protein
MTQLYCPYADFYSSASWTAGQQPCSLIGRRSLWVEFNGSPPIRCLVQLQTTGIKDSFARPPLKLRLIFTLRLSSKHRQTTRLLDARRFPGLT